MADESKPPVAIHKKLTADGTKISLQTVRNILNQRKQGLIRHETQVEDHSESRRTVRTRENVRKIWEMMGKTENPPTLKQSAPPYCTNEM